MMTMCAVVLHCSNKDLRKSRKYFAKKIPCNVMMMNEEGHADIIKGRPLLDSSPICMAPTPKLVKSEQLKQILEEVEEE